MHTGLDIACASAVITIGDAFDVYDTDCVTDVEPRGDVADVLTPESTAK